MGADRRRAGPHGRRVGWRYPAGRQGARTLPGRRAAGRCQGWRWEVWRARRRTGGQGMVIRPDTVAARLGGFPGIQAFLKGSAVPALLADPEIASFFGHLSESADDIDTCLAMLLDHDLGGSSAHFGAVLTDGHQCRSSMTEIHRGRMIPDAVVDKFIGIVGQQAKLAGVSDADIQEVAKVLDRYRGGVR